ncbi:MAG: hypothetical protein NVS4B10_03990 [Myxococcales bacterium]
MSRPALPPVLRALISVVAVAGCARRPAAPAVDPVAANAQQFARAMAALPAETLPPPALEDLFWTTYGQQGTTLLQVRQTAKGRGSCTVTCMRGADRLWFVDRCLARRGQLRFVSPDGERLIVLLPEPEVDGPAGDVEVGSLWKRGVLVRRYTVAQVLGSLRGTRVEAGQLRWLHRNLPEEIEGGVRVTLADGRGEFLYFDGTGVPDGSSAALRAQPVVLSGGGRRR